MNKPIFSLRSIYNNFTLHTFGLVFLAVTVPLIYSRALANGTNLPRYALTSVIIITSFILFLSSFYRKPTLSVNKTFLFILAGFIWSAISILWSRDYGNSLIEISYFYSSLLILFLAMQIKEYHQQRFIIDGAIFGLFLVVIIGLLQSIGLNPLYIHYLGLPSSTFINPNHASIYVEFFIPVLFLLIFYGSNNFNKIIYSIILGLSLSFLYLLSSFGTLVSLILATIIIVFILSKHSNLLHTLKNNKINLIVVFLVCTITLLIITTNTDIKLKAATELRPISLIAQKNSHKIRLGLYLKSFQAIKDEPILGFGYGGFRAGILPYISEIQAITHHNEHLYFLKTHNDFLQQFTETGILGGVLFIAFFFIILSLGFNSIKNKKLTEKNIFIFTLTSGLLVLILHAFIDFPFHLSASNFLIYLTSGFILSSTAKNVTFNRDFYLKASVIFFITLFSLTLIASISYNFDRIKSSKLIRDTAIALHKEKNCMKAISYIDESNQLFKYDFQSQASQAQIYGICPQNIEKQRIIINNLILLNPTNFRARILRGNISLLNGKPNLAFKDYFYVVKMLPESAIGYISLGKWALKVNKLEDAREYFEKANNIAPNNTEVNFILKQLINSPLTNNIRKN